MSVFSAHCGARSRFFRLRAAVLVVLVPLLREAVRRVPADVFLFDAVFFVRVLVFFVFANGKYHLFLL